MIFTAIDLMQNLHVSTIHLLENGGAVAGLIAGIIFLIIFLAVFLSASVKVVKEYERAVIFRLGRLLGAKGPGLFFVIPGIDKFIRVDLRTIAVDVPEQQIITRDNVTVGVDAVIYYRVVDPVAAVTRVTNFHYAVSLIAQTTLRDVIGQVELDDLLAKRDEINKRIQGIIDEITGAWGVKVTAVTLRQVRLPETMLRAMAKQAEAERWRRAKVIEAEAEREAAKILAEAAQVFEGRPAALRLRELHTLVEIAREKNLVIITPSVAGSEFALLGMLYKQKSSEKEGG